jgi:hypothetical protein
VLGLERRPVEVAEPEHDVRAVGAANMLPLMTTDG